MYQVLARKYRPRNFNQLVGQTHVSRALTSALERNRLHHAYLFTGTRGVGKTTIARILSKCLNCETGITDTPCEVCATCVAINQGRFIDLIEIDAASRTKVEDTRELLDNVPYAPTQGRYKVYLIDEVHMLSTHSFNALLKTLEEPPEHVKFLLATTDPQKLPVTVLSRCLQFTLRPLQQQEIHDHLHNILDQEQIGYDDKALWQLAEAAQGSLRDALSLTDQAIAFGQGQLQGSDVQDMLGLLDKGQIVYLLQAIYVNNGHQVSQILQNLANQAVDLKAVLDQLITLLHQLALLQVLPQVPLQGTQEYQQQLQQLAQGIDPTDIQLYYQVALQGRQDLKLAVSLQQGFDMCILRMLAFKPLGNNSQILQHSSSNSNVVTSPQLAVSKHESAIAQTAHAMPDDLSSADNDNSNTVTASDVQPSIDLPAMPEQSSTPPEIAEQADFQQAAPEQSPFLNDGIVLDDVAESVILENSSIETIENQAVAADVLMQGEFLVNQRNESSVQSEQLPVAPVTEVLSPINGVSAIASDAPLNTMPQSADEPWVKASHAVLDQRVPETPIAVNAPVHAEPAPRQLMPQQILQHHSVELTGTWDIEKWECWLREAEISPAIRNLAQHGLIRGTVGQASTFVISPEHRLLATELFEGLELALQQHWPACRVELVFESIAEPLPLQLKAIRREKALQQADYLLRQEPVIQPLIERFAANLTNITLKE